MTDQTLAPRQSLSTVIRAEFGRQLRRRRVLVTLGVTAIVVLLGAWGLVLSAKLVDDGLTSAAFALPLALEFSAGLVCLMMGFVVLATVTGETADGTVLTSLMLVPNRSRLLFARALVWPAVATALLLGLSPLVIALGSAVQLPGSASLPALLLSVGVAVVAVALVTALSFLTATALRRGAIAMAVAIGCFLVLPLAVGVLQVAGPEALRPASAALLVVVPGTAALKALSVSSTGLSGWGQVVEGLVVLACWVLATGIGAVAVFRREGAATT